MSGSSSGALRSRAQTLESVGKENFEMANDDEQTGAKAGDDTYHVDRLLAESQEFFGVPEHVLAGALDGEQKKNLTLAEAKKLIEKFHKIEVVVPAGDAA